ncbi:MAG: ABC transporter, partial [Spirochaetes bacterium]
PKQIIEIRELIKDLGKEHTVVLSSHILPEISATCSRILIINNGEIVASDTPENLSSRLSGTSGSARQKLLIKGDTEKVKSALEKVPSIDSITTGSGPEDGLTEAIISASGTRDIREDVFRAMASADYPILQIAPMDLSLEEIFLNLTTSEEEI